MPPIASRYAKAFFRMDLPLDTLELIQKQLEEIVQLLKAQNKLKQLLLSPLIPKVEKGDLLSKIFGQKIDPLLLNFLLLLLDKGRLAALPDITNAFKQNLQAKSGILDAHLETAIPLELKQKKRLLQNLEHHFKKKIDLKERINPNIEGGARLYVGHYILDTTIRKQLSRLKTYLHTYR